MTDLRDIERVVRLLRAGDKLFLTQRADGDVWLLERAELSVDHHTVRELQMGGPLLEPFGGRLMPSGDHLPLGSAGGLAGHYRAQTWTWVEGGTQ